MSHRSGYTLTEILVVVGIIAVLATLGVVFLPTISQSQRINNASEQLQGKIMIARTKALSEQTPRGVRLMVSTDDNHVRQLIYIEPSEGVSGGNIWLGSTSPVGTNQWRIQADKIDMVGALGNRVQPGDQLVVAGFPPLTIVQVTPSGRVGGYLVVQSSAAPPGVPVSPQKTANFAVVRAPRPLAGEEPLDLPDDIVIDLTSTYPNGLRFSQVVPDPGHGTYDIMFAPSGKVLGANASLGKIILGIRDLNETVPSTNTRLLVIYPLTGMIAGHPVDRTNNFADPFSFTRDGMSSGL